MNIFNIGASARAAEREAAVMAQAHQAVVESERALRKSLVRAQDDRLSLEELLGFKREIDLQGLDETRIISALLVVDEETPLWIAVHALLNAMERDELGAALRPGLSAEDRAYNNGRAAVLSDFRALLLQQWNKARVSNRQSK